MKKLIIRPALMLCTLISLVACNNRSENSVQEVTETAVVVTNEPEITEAVSDNEVGETASETLTEPFEEVSVSAKLNRAIVKEGDILYSKADNFIKSFNLTDQTEITLYETAEQGTVLDYFLYGDKIYLLDYYYKSDTDSKTSLYVVNKDGLGKRLLKDDMNGMDWQVYFYQKQLYLYDFNEHYCYALSADGTLGKQIEDQNTAYRYLPVGYNEIWQRRLLGAANSLACYNSIWAELSGGMPASINPEDGSMKKYDVPVGRYVIAVTKDYIISRHTNELNYDYYLTDEKTGESRQWFQGAAQYIDHDEDGCYFSFITEEGGIAKTFTYKKISWDGTEQTLFTEDVAPGMYQETSGGVTDFTVIEDTIYYHYAAADRMYLMSRKLDSPETITILGGPYDNKMLSALGHVEVCNDKVYSSVNPEIDILDIFSERFIFDGASEAVKKMNEKLKTLQEEDINAAISYAMVDEQSFAEFSMAAYSHMSVVMGFTFLSDRYVCIYQYDYEYTGGAHGMPYRKYYIFDLASGEMLTLKDIVGNTEKEAHDTILEYFTASIKGYPEKYDSTAAETVNQTAGLSSQFYLTSEGIGIYYAPYDLACYAAGFQEVIIPFSEFNMLIDVSGAKDIIATSEQGMY